MASAPHVSTAWRVLRNLADLVLVALFPFSLDLLLRQLPPTLPAAGVLSFFAEPIAGAAMIWLLLRLQGQRFADVGLKRVPVGDTIMQGVALAALLFAVALVTEAMGFVRDFSSIRAQLEGKPETLALFVAYSFVGAGLYEELKFRGFALDRFARMFGESRAAWAIAAVLQGVLFGLGHAYQGTYAIFYTGGISVLFASVLLFNGRNLWALVLGHAFYDAARFIFYYVIWTYYGG